MKRKKKLPMIRRTDTTEFELSAEMVKKLAVNVLGVALPEGEPVIEVVQKTRWESSLMMSADYDYTSDTTDYPIRVRFVKKTEIK